MAVKVTSKRFPGIRHSGKTAPKFDTRTVAAAIGAEEERGSAAALLPHEFRHLAAQFEDRLQSSGGRPGLAGTPRRQKIP
jgi:hypothetical protein